LLALIVFIISFILASIIFVSRNKIINSILSILSILVNIFFVFNQGLFYTFPVASGVGSFGFVVNYLNFPFILTILIVTSVTVIYSLKYMEVRFHELGGGSWRLYYGLYTLFAISMLYTVLSTNLLEAYIFIEIALVTSFGLILLYGYGDRRRISLLYFIWTHVGTILTLSSILILGIQTGKMDIYQDAFTFLNYSSIAYSPLVFMLGVIGMFVKAALAGFNIWLPYAHGEAPTPISVLLSPNMVGLGVFVVILYFYLFPNFSYLSPIFIIWSLITMIYGGVNAIAQKDFKRFLAYSSVSQMGYMTLGASVSFYLGLNDKILSLPLGILASILMYASHGFGKAILFMSAGAAITELNNRNIDKLGGLYLTSPIHTTLSFIGILNLLGLPPTIGLISEVLLLLSSGALFAVNFGLGITVFILLIIAIGVSAGYATYLFKKVYSGVNYSNKINDKIIEYTLPMLLLAAFSILFFFFPEFLSYSANILSVSSFGAYNPLPATISMIPLLASLLSLIIPSKYQDLRGGLSTLLIGVSALLAGVNLAYTIINYKGEFYLPASSFTLFSYFTFSSSLIQAILGLFVSVLSFFIALYSIGYMKEDKVLRRYWSLFTLFVASMLMVVYSDNIILFLAGWEGTGLASYALISYWLDDNEKNVVGDFGRRIFGLEYVSKPTISGIRALVFTRIGDVGLLLGLGFLLFLISRSPYVMTNSFEIYNSLFPSTSLGYGFTYFYLILIIIALGGLAKSAQLPFTQWLLTAMTGPTPVSALIHAATMVNLGAIFTFIFYPFLDLTNPQTFIFLVFMLTISTLTAVYTSVNALGSNEQKVILAYSTADQISLMILSSSLGGTLGYILSNKELLYLGIIFGLIQMIAHGIYKATLFMNTGSVIHITESRYVGHNVFKKAPVVSVLQLLAVFNLANIPFTVGFLAHNLIGELASNLSIVYWIYLLVEFLGAFYITRYFIKTFAWRQGKEPHEAHIHPTMVVSPFFLVITSIALGVYSFPLLEIVRVSTNSEIDVGFSILEFLISLLGIIVAFLIYGRGLEIGSKVKSLSDILYYGWYLNPVFDKLGELSYKLFGIIFTGFETGIIDNTLNVKLPYSMITVGSKLVRFFQTGILREYIGMYMVGLALLLIILIIIGVL